MGFKISDAHEIMAKALDARALKQKVIASNIANVSTPFYKAKGVAFENALLKELNSKKTKSLQLAKTNKAHLDSIQDKSDTKPTIFIRDGHTTRNDGNSVDIDIETTQMSKNIVMFNALSAALKKDSMIFKSVIESSSKV